jgi:hypothetical protein
MKRPVGLIVGVVAGALLVAGAGVSAHTAIVGIGQHSSVQGDEATGARTEAPEATETPEAAETPEPAEAPEAQQAQEQEDNDVDEDQDKDVDADEDHGGGGDD